MCRVRCRLCLAATLVLCAVFPLSPVSASSLSEQINEHVRELARKVALCIIDRDKCLPDEIETERECHVNERNEVCCEIRRSVIFELDNELRDLQDKKQQERREDTSSKSDQHLMELLSDPRNVAHQADDAAEVLKDILGARFKAELERDGSSDEQCAEFTRQQVKRNYTSVLRQIRQSGSWLNFTVNP